MFKIIENWFNCQGVSLENVIFNKNSNSTILELKSTRRSEDFKCPVCGGHVHIHDAFKSRLKTIFIPEKPAFIKFSGHRFRCSACGETFTEKTPFKYPGTRITTFAAQWIKALLSKGLSISAAQKLTGIHWDTIQRVQKEVMDKALAERKQVLTSEGYRPTFLAVDEFAIYKGHRYATCVMDLETGELIWVGKGRAKKDFAKFFEEVKPSFLSEVKAVAMDMNAAYNVLVEEHLPKAKIVYDRYHMQAQFGRDVLGVVRLEEARKHQDSSKALKSSLNKISDKAEKKDIKEKAQAEQRAYNKLKKARWTLLMNADKLKTARKISLEAILSEHESLAVCYAMKEEMTRLFELRDEKAAKDGWKRWFEAAKASGISALEKFARLKEKRLPGLIAHAVYPINTGKLEGFNNKIKVAKRIGYGYRNERYFFTLIRYLSLPSVRNASPKFS